MMSGLSSCPDKEYVTKARTDAMPGIEIATAFAAARTISNDRIYPISRARKSEILFRNGISQAKYLITFMPPSSSWSSFARLSVHIMLFWRKMNIFFITYVCAGVARMRNPNPARALGPRFSRRSTRQMAIWIGAAQAIWKNPAQKSIRETSVEM